MPIGLKRFLVIVMAVLPIGCATTSPNKPNPEIQQIIKATSSVRVIVLRAEASRMTAGGVVEKVDEWCRQAHRNLENAAIEILGGKAMLEVKALPESMMSESVRINLADTRALFEAVVGPGYKPGTAGPNAVPYHGYTWFDYSLGTEVQDLARGVDALLIISCVDIDPTEGRQAVQAATLAASMPLVLFGVAPVMLPGEFTSATVSLVEAKSGKIIWLKGYQSTAAHHLTDPLKTMELMKILLKEFPLT